MNRLKKIAVLCRHLLKDPASSQYAFDWLQSNFSPRPELKKQYPWLVFKAITWLESYLTRDMLVFEYGSGGSTFYFAQRAKKVISVEYDVAWHAKLMSYLKSNEMPNMDLLLFQADLTTPRNYSHTSYSSAKFRDLNFENFVKSIENYPDRSFDLILVDGRARASCLAHAIKKVRPGGYIMLDNSEREEYSQAKELLQKYDRQDFVGIGPYNTRTWMTTIWQIKD